MVRGVESALGLIAAGVCLVDERHARGDVHEGERAVLFGVVLKEDVGHRADQVEVFSARDVVGEEQDDADVQEVVGVIKMLSHIAQEMESGPFAISQLVPKCRRGVHDAVWWWMPSAISEPLAKRTL